jgi:GcrA cell cycle regulator
LAEANAGEHCVAPVTLLDLKSTSCRWPVNEGNPFLFCGERAREGGPYCAHHAARAVGEGTRSERAAARELKRQADRETPIMSSVE